MLKRSNILGWLACVAWLAIVALPISMAACGSDEDTYVQTSKRDRNATADRSPSPAPTPPAPVTPDPETLATQSDETLAEAVEEPPVTDEVNREVTYEEAEAAFFERRYDDAVTLFTAYTERKDRNPWGFYMLGISAWKMEHYEAAETAFARALELDPKHFKSYINLSRVLLDTERPTEALEKLDEALAIDAESNVAHRLRGRAFHQLGRIEEAVGAYRRAIQIDDRDAWSMNNLGLVFIEQGRFDDALPPLARAVELKDDVAMFYNNLGMALEWAGHVREAEDAYQTAFDLDQSYGNASANLDRVSQVYGDPDVAPIDLAAVAQAFVDEIGTWSETVVASEQTEPTDAIGVPAAATEPDSSAGLEP